MVSPLVDGLGRVGGVMTRSRIAIDDERDAYGALPPDPNDEDFDLEQLAAAVHGLLVEHPPISTRRYYFYGSAVYATILDHAFDLMPGLTPAKIHPQSEYAGRMVAIADGIVGAVLDRLANEFGWSETQKDQASEALTRRVRIGRCQECGGPTLTPRVWWCDTCEQRMAAKSEIRPAPPDDPSR